MKLSSTVLGALALGVSSAYGTALTYKVAANEKACFFTDVQRQGAKIAFYFAVRTPCPAKSMLRNGPLTKLCRCNRAVPSTSTMKSSAPTTGRSWQEKKKDRATLSSRRKTWASIECASTM